MMDIYELINTAEKNDIQINEEQASLILDCLKENGYDDLVEKENSLELQWIDQSGDMNKEVSIDQILVFVTDKKYNENINIMDELDEIKTISLDNITLYCTKLHKLIENEKELRLIQNALLQTKRFKELKQSIEPINNNKKFVR